MGLLYIAPAGDTPVPGPIYDPRSPLPTAGELYSATYGLFAAELGFVSELIGRLYTTCST
jgi:hypothetical protein